jgi:hypothetical protein
MGTELLSCKKETDEGEIMRKTARTRKNEAGVGRYLLRVIALGGLIGLIVWAAWYAPWNRKPQSVSVTLVDSPTSTSSK